MSPCEAVHASGLACQPLAVREPPAGAASAARRRLPGEVRTSGSRALAAAVWVAALIWSCAASGAALERDGVPGPVRSASEVGYPPFGVVGADGAADGFPVRLMRAALARMGRDVTFRTGPWSEVRGWLERGEIDALPLVGRTPEREGLFDFTVPYLTMRGAIVVRDGTADVRTLEDLRGRRVGVMAGDNAEEFLRRDERGLEIVTTPTFGDAFHALAGGRVDAVVMQRLVAFRLLRETGLTGLRVLDRPIPGFEQEFCFAVREGDRELLSLLNEGLALVVADGTHRRLQAEWLASYLLPADRPIVVGGDHAYPPFEYLDDAGRPAGYTVDLTRAIAAEMGLDVVFRLGPWHEVVRALEKGEVDVLQGMFYLPGRDEFLDFSQPHAASSYVAVVRRGEGAPPESLGELAGRRLVVQRGDAIHDYLVGQGVAAELAFADSQEEVLRQLAEGRHDCALAVRVSALDLVEARGFRNLQLGRRPLVTLDYCYAAMDGREAVLAQFSEGLKALERSGEYQRIHDEWLGVHHDTPLTLLDALRTSALVLVPLLAVLVVAALWTWSLRRQVAARTRELRDSLERFQAVFEAANAGKSMTLPTGEVQANQALADMLGYSRGELDAMTWQELTPPEDVPEIERCIAPLLDGRQGSARFEKRYLHRDGSVVWGDVSVTLRRDPEGRPLHFITTVVDITDRRSAEEALRSAEERQRAMIACSPVALYTVDMDGIVTTWNPSCERVFGWSAAEAIGRPLPIVPEDRAEEFAGLRRRVLEEGGFFGLELDRLRKDGSLIPISLSVAPVRDGRGETIAIMGAALDLSDRKTAERRVEHLNRVLRAIRDVNQLITHETDRDRLLARTCEILVSTRGYRSAWVAVHDGDGTVATVAECGAGEGFAAMRASLERGVRPECWRRAAASPEGFARVRDTQLNCTSCAMALGYGDTAAFAGVLRHGGRDHGVLVVALPEGLSDDDDELSLFRELVGDVAYALHAMEETRRRRAGEERFRSYVEHAPYGIFVADREGRYLEVNPAAADLTGYPEERLLSMTIADLLPPDAGEAGLAHFRSLLESGRASRELEHVHAGGERRRWMVSAVALDGDRFLGFAEDVTDRRRIEAEREQLQSQLAQAQKLESVGRLAGGVAHDFNNILQAMMAASDLLLVRLPEGDDRLGLAREISGGVERAAALTRQLLAFARRQTIRPEVLDLNETVETMLKMMRRLIGEDVDLLWRPGPGLWPVRLDPGQVDQILANLCVNARDAIVGVGRLTIETGNVTFDEAYCARHAGFSAGEFVMLAVSDDGCGMDAATCAQVFEPFFTTKGPHEGTGLGLATVYGIVKQNEGFVNVYSEPGEGTTFKVYVPRHHGGPVAHGPARTAPEPRGSGESVLLVEDDPAILDMIGEMLCGMGYDVHAAAETSDALGKAAGLADRLAVLITDVVMPGMSGRDLASAVQDLCPRCRVLYMSGYTANVIAHRGVLEEGVHFIQKPFSGRDLATRIRQLLDG